MTNMTIETCYKYLVFLNRECDRYLKDSRIVEDEIHQLQIELGRFRAEVMNSELPSEIKTKIAALNITYQFKGYREYLPLLGSWNLGKHKRRRELKKTVEDFKHTIDGLPMFIKMNYSFENEA